MDQPFETILELDSTKSRSDNITHIRSSTQFNGPGCSPPNAVQVNCGVVVGVFAGFSESGEPMVKFRGDAIRGLVPVRSMVALAVDQIGCEVVAAYERGDLERPIVLGCLQPSTVIERKEQNEKQIDRPKLELFAERQIELRCGKASITLTRAGKVVISGTFVMSRSSGVNRILGGSVQIN